MKRQGHLYANRILMIISILAAATACSSLSSPKIPDFPVNGDQRVPFIVAIGPFDTATVQYNDSPLVPDVEIAIQERLRNALQQIGVFKDVRIVRMNKSAGTPPDPGEILALARAQNADLLLVGYVKDFDAKLSLPLPRSHFDVKMGLVTQIYDTDTGSLVLQKTEKVMVARDGWGRRGMLGDIVSNVVVPSLTDGLLPSLVKDIQKAYLASEDRIGIESKVLAKIDAELAPPKTQAGPKDHAYAIIIGVEKYRDLPKADYATRDAEKIKEYVTKSLGYREENVWLLLNDRVTRSQLAARFEEWLPKQVRNNHEAEIFVYYSGHGAPDVNTNQSFLVPYDGDPAYLETTAYPLKKLYQVLSDLPARHITVVLDTCFSGAGGRSVIPKGAKPVVMVEQPTVVGTNIVVFTASSANQISSSYRDKRYGLFTYYFLKGLQGEADINQDRAIEIEELASYVRSNVAAVATRLNLDQNPQLIRGPEALGVKAKQEIVKNIGSIP